MTNGDPGSGPITAQTPFTPDDDMYHPARSDDPYWAETNWWSFNVPERQLGGWLHARFDVNRGVVTWRVFVWDPSGADVGRLAYHRTVVDEPMPAEPDLRDITFPGGGFSVKMIEPLLRYEISYSDPGRDFSIAFEHRAVHPPRRFTPGEPPAMYSPHLDQLGHQVGELVLHGESIAIGSYSVRDRTWGPRGGHHMQSRKAEHVRGEHRVLESGGPRWREIERERGRGRIEYIFGHTGPNTGFLGFVRPQDGDSAGWSPMNHGWLLRDGQFENLDKTRSRMRNFRDPKTGWSAHMDVELTDLAGRTMTAEGFAVSHICEGGFGSTALMRWEMNGEIGWGEDQDGWKRDHWTKMMSALRATGRHVS